MNKKPDKALGAHLHNDGVRFGVWAPFADAVFVTGSFNDWGRYPMKREGSGCWFAEVAGATAGEEYKFVIKNGDHEFLKNDPRALQLTTDPGNGVIVDHTFDWEGDDFRMAPVDEQVLYELHVGTFHRIDAATQGTFRTAIEKLDYLADLGITAVEIMPIGSMYMDRGWGYASDYIYAVESLYGGRYEFMEFVKAAHQRNIGVVLDVAYNHLGPDSSIDLWQFDGWSENGKGGIYFYNDWRCVTPWGDTRPDYGRAEVRRYVTDNVRMWLEECHVDGLRVDSTIFMRNVKGRNNDPEHDLADGWKLLQEITDVSRTVKSSALLIAEDTSGNDYITKRVQDGGAGFASQWEVGFPQVLRDVLLSVRDEDRDIENLSKVLAQTYNGDCFQRVIYSDSHDSAANGGARLNEQITPGEPASVFACRRSLIAAAVILTAPGMPMLFQGQEFMEGGSFNDWQELRWEHAAQFDGMVLAYRHLIALRKNTYGHTKGLRGQGYASLQVDNMRKLIAYHRWSDGTKGDDVVVVINFSNVALENYSLAFPKAGKWTVRFNSDWKGYSQKFTNTTIDIVEVDINTGSLQIGPYSVLILSQDKE